MTVRTIRRTLMLAVLVGAASLVFGVGSAFAKPCWLRVIDDWYDGRIDGVYSAACLNRALENAPEDIRQYSDLQTAITRKLASGRERTGAGTGVQAAPGSRSQSSSGASPAPKRPSTTSSDGGNADPDRQSAAAVPSSGPDDGGGGPKGPIARAMRDIGPADSSSVPLPLLALGGLAALLMASGVAGVATRHIRARRAAAAAPPKQA